MSKCCKDNTCWTKFLPHNWLCLKGLSVLFLVVFYIAIVFAVYMAFQISMHPMVTGREMWIALGYYVGQALVTAVFCLTVSKILKALAAIKHAVAPCCCGTEKTEKKEKAK